MFCCIVFRHHQSPSYLITRTTNYPFNALTLMRINTKTISDSKNAKYHLTKNRHKNNDMHVQLAKRQGSRSFLYTAEDRQVCSLLPQYTQCHLQLHSTVQCIGQCLSGLLCVERESQTTCSFLHHHHHQYPSSLTYPLPLLFHFLFLIYLLLHTPPFFSFPSLYYSSHFYSFPTPLLFLLSQPPTPILPTNPTLSYNPPGPTNQPTNEGSAFPSRVPFI